MKKIGKSMIKGRKPKGINIISSFSYILYHFPYQPLSRTLFAKDEKNCEKNARYKRTAGIIGEA